MTRRLALSLLLAAGCGDDPKPEEPPQAPLVVEAEDGTELWGELVVFSRPGARNLVTLDLQARVPPEEEAPHHDVSWTLKATVPRNQALARHVELDWPSSQAEYRSAHGAGTSGTMTIDFTGGRATGTVTSAGGSGAQATFDGEVKILCEVSRDKFGEPIYDESLDDPECSPLKPLLR